MDKRLETIIATVPSRSDQGALRTVLQIAVNTTGGSERRRAVFEQFEQRIGHGLGGHVARLATVFETVLGEEQAKADEFDSYITKAKQKTAAT